MVRFKLTAKRRNVSSAAATPVALKSAKKVLYSKEKWSILPFLCLLTFIYVVLY